MEDKEVAQTAEGDVGVAVGRGEDIVDDEILEGILKSEMEGQRMICD